MSSGLLSVEPIAGFVRHAGTVRFSVPSSKPETQRAIALAAMAPGASVVHNDLRCLETTTMKTAVRALGANVSERDGHLEIEGVDLKGRCLSDLPIIDCKGSGLVCRMSAAVASAMGSSVVITGDDILRRREMRALFDALDKRNGSLRYLCEPWKIPVVVRGTGLAGGVYEVPGDISSQFITALLVAAPLARSPVEVRVTGTVMSGSYIRQTVAAMKMAGIAVVHDDALSSFQVPVGTYKPFETRISGDYTSASYFLAAAALFEGRTVLSNMDSQSLQGERAMLDVIDALGLTTRFDPSLETLEVENKTGRLIGDFEFDASDCPNIVPTLAAIGMFVEGIFRVKGAAITRLHKSPRVEAMVAELTKLGADVKPLYARGVLDGFEVRGRRRYRGGVSLSSWRDHRIFMSLFVASLRMERPNLIDGYADTSCSFPGFLEQFQAVGARFAPVSGPADDASEGSDRRESVAV
jgi:3-phosphoshikimate 1-carboxyvinyltransferase